MLWILLFAGMGVALFAFLCIVIIAIPEKDGEATKGFAVFMVIALIVGLIGHGGLKGIDMLSYTEIEQTDTLELVSLSDDSQISGRASGGGMCFVVAIDITEVYSFYYKVKDNGFARRTVDANHTIIYESENCTPCVVEYTTYTKNRMNGVLRTILAFGYGGERQQKSYEIYVPAGTIVRTFALDTQ